MNFFSRLFRRPNPLTKPSATADHRSSTWIFDQAPTTAAIVTRQVLEGAEIRAVVHYADDHCWAFLCGTTDDGEDGRIVTMAQALEMDATLRTIADLPPGWKASREGRGETWARAENPEKDAALSSE